MIFVSSTSSAALAEPETVSFKSADGETTIVAYLFRPQLPGPHPAIVLLHGRTGPYSANVNSDCAYVSPDLPSHCNAMTLSKRHSMWGEFWAAHGVLALLPDSFGPRGKAYGFSRFSHGTVAREDVNELTVRPLDAEGALAYLRSQQNIVTDKIFLQGWSNGASTALNVIIRQGNGIGFRGALVFYPGCGRRSLLEPIIRTSTPISIFLGGADEEISPGHCKNVASRSIAVGSAISLTVYAGATHDFDDPGDGRQAIEANRAAKADVMDKAASVVDSLK